MNSKIKERSHVLIRILIITVAFLTLSSCGFCIVLSKQYYFTSDGGVRPRKNRFFNRKEPYILKEHDLIKTVGVYQFSYVWDEKGLKVQPVHSNYPNAKTSFIRFFKNGRFLMNELNPKENELDQYNNLKKGKVGYYEIIENTLILEYFSVRFGGMASDCGKYYRSKYELNKNSIKMYAERRSSNGTFYAWIEVENNNWYNLKNVEGLSETPDW